MKTRLIVMGLCAVCAVPSYGQYDRGQMQQPAVPMGTASTKVPTRKSRPMLHRAKAQTPEAQLIAARELREAGRLKDAGRAFEALVRTWHDSDEAVLAQTENAELLVTRKRYTDAFDEYQYLIDFFSDGYSFTNALNKQFKIAHHVMTKKSPKFLGMGSVERPERALKLFEALVDNAPNWGRAPQVHYMMGLIHEQADHFLLAADEYQIIQDRFPGSEYAADAAFREANCTYKVAKKNRRDEESYQRALASMTLLMRRYPDYEGLDDARKMQQEIRVELMNMYYERAAYYDRIAKKPKSAIVMYEDLIRSFPLSDRAAEARERVKELKTQNGETDE